MNVGVVGVGHLGKQHARLYAGMPDVRLAGVVDIVPDRAREVAAAYAGVEAWTDYRELFGRVDAISLAAPTSNHADIGVEFLERGIDVLVEKPIASNLPEARRLISASKDKGRILQVGHVERFNPAVTTVIGLATTPQFFEIHRLAAFSPRSLDVDVVLDLMIHDLDIVLHLVRSPVTEIRAVGIPVLSEKADIANARVQFENGCVANLTASRVSTEKVRKLRFFQPHDYVSIDYAAQSGTMISLRNGRVGQRKIEPQVQEPLKLELESFVRSVRTRAIPVVTGEDGLKALELGLRINEAIANHRTA